MVIFCISSSSFVGNPFIAFRKELEDIKKDKIKIGKMKKSQIYHCHLQKFYSFVNYMLKKLYINCASVKLKQSTFYFYAPITIAEGIMFSGLCLHSLVSLFVRLLYRSSVCLYVRPSVCLSCFRRKFLVKLVFDEIEVQLASNLVHMFLMI